MTVVSLGMAYRSLREVLAVDTRLDTPPSTKRRHPDSAIAPGRRKPDVKSMAITGVAKSAAQPSRGEHSEWAAGRPEENAL
jgi:hypothetical protein